jgi:hypothetical protein
MTKNLKAGVPRIVTLAGGWSNQVVEEYPSSALQNHFTSGIPEKTLVIIGNMPQISNTSIEIISSISVKTVSSSRQ